MSVVPPRNTRATPYHWMVCEGGEGVGVTAENDTLHVLVVASTRVKTMLRNKRPMLPNAIMKYFYVVAQLLIGLGEECIITHRKAPVRF